MHSVYFSFRPEVARAQRTELIGELAALSETLAGFIAFDAGPNRDFENKSSAYQDGFIISFDDPAALARYAVHPTHLQLGAELCNAVKNGADGIMVFDLEVPDR